MMLTLKICYKINSYLGNKYAGYEHIYGNFRGLLFVAGLETGFVITTAGFVVCVAALTISSATACAVGINGTSAVIRGLPIGGPPLPLCKDAMSSKLGYWFSSQ
jgi:hypothetical protein